MSYLFTKCRQQMNYSIGQQSEVSPTISGEDKTPPLNTMSLSEHLVQEVQYYHSVPEEFKDV